MYKLQTKPISCYQNYSLSLLNSLVSNRESENKIGNLVKVIQYIRKFVAWSLTFVWFETITIFSESLCICIRISDKTFNFPACSAE